MAQPIHTRWPTWPFLYHGYIEETGELVGAAAPLQSRPAGGASQSAAEATLGLVTVDILGLAGTGVPPAEQPALAVGQVWLTGFEEIFDTASIMQFWMYNAGFSGISLLTTGARSGTRCLRIAMGASQDMSYLENYVNNPHSTTTHIRLAFYAEQFSTTRSVPLLSFLDIFNAALPAGIALKATTGASSKLIVDGTVELATDIQLATWYLCEMAFASGAGDTADRQYRLSTDAGAVLETSAVFSGAHRPLYRLRLGPTTSGPAGSGYAFRLDDMAVVGDAAKTLSDWIGYGRVGAWKLNATISATWSLIGASPPQHTALDEIPGAVPSWADRVRGTVLNSEDRFGGAPEPPLIPGATVRRFGVCRKSNGRSISLIWPPLGPPLIESGTNWFITSASPITIECGGRGLEWPAGEPGTTLANIQIGHRVTNLAGGNPEVESMWGTFDEDTTI
jgi:hypothetical protein